MGVSYCSLMGAALGQAKLLQILLKAMQMNLDYLVSLGLTNTVRIITSVDD